MLNIRPQNLHIVHYAIYECPAVCLFYFIYNFIYSGIRLTRISRDQKNLFLLKAFCVK
jgi:hypothetical protein